jgi:hypothetical protein
MSVAAERQVTKILIGPRNKKARKKGVFNLAENGTIYGYLSFYGICPAYHPKPLEKSRIPPTFWIVQDTTT